MNILTAATDFIGGGLFKEIKEAVVTYFPPSMSDQQKAEAQLGIERMLAEKQATANKVLNDAARSLDKRIAEQEGTAKDLLKLPVVGRLMIFARGMQRPVWGFSTLLIDYKWFFSVGLTFSDRQEQALIVINLLVLGFLFGERAVKNLEPLILKIFEKVAK